MNDLRAFIKELDEAGELLTIEAEVDWNLEAAAIATMCCRIGGPALHFRKIKGYPEGYSLAGNLFSGTQKKFWPRTAISLGLSKDIGYEEFKAELKRRLAHPIRPTVVNDGPCKEEVHLGKEVNIFEFPLPYLHYGDGGRYGGTCHAVIVKDPDSDWQNWGQYRWMAHNKNKLGGSFHVGQQMPTLYYQKYEARNIPMPFCIALGGPPSIVLVSTLPIPVGQSEADYIGGLELQPLELIKAETNELLVPAQAEIIIEGEVLPYERWDEGPFGDYDGFMNAPRFPRPVYRVHCITHRKNPIYPFIQEGVKVNDTQTMYNAIFPALVEEGLVFSGYPIKRAGFLGECIMPAVSTEVPYRGYVEELFNYFRSMGISNWFHKIGIFDNYVNPSNMDQALEELILKVHPSRDYIVSDCHAKLPQVAIWANSEERKRGYTSVSYFDASTPLDHGKVKELIGLESCYSERTLEWLKEKWQELGFHEEPEFYKK